VIASVQGRLAAKGEDHLIVQMGGLGIKVYVPSSVLDQAPLPGEEITLVTHLHVRETELSLYGFETPQDRELFLLLLGVSGIGPRSALNVLSTLAPESLREAISSGNVAALVRVPGIGKKTAQRMVLDLGGKVGDLSEAAMSFGGITAAEAEVIGALTSLGYSIAEAQEAVRALPDEKLTVEESVFQALQRLGGAA
jgi:holliday junction DNA helicase RuvA